MTRAKVLAVGLDGLEISHAEHLMAAGKMPRLRALRSRGITAMLDHGPAARTGLAWEHFASARSPCEAERAAAVEFDPISYRVWQEGGRFLPFWEELDVRTLVFDAPYVHLDLARRTRGVVAWGAHDPGTRFAARPASLATEIPPYPASEWTYAVPWSSPDACRRMGVALVEALEVRSAAVRTMLERYQDWDLCVVVAGEPHTATEGLWHGVDPSHPASLHPSAPAARRSLDDIYDALDRFLGEVVDAAGPDVDVVAFSPGGMGRNESDVASMFLLGELLHRYELDAPLAVVPTGWRGRLPHELTIPDGASWEEVVLGCFSSGHRLPSASGALRRLAAPVRRLGRIRRRSSPSVPDGELRGPVRSSLDWMPITRYRERWPQMRAFALPSFYDGRVRVNLEGRERLGKVSADDYEAVCDEIEGVVRACCDPRTGAGVVGSVERHQGDPYDLRSDEADVVVVWSGVFNAVEHPVLGQIGPVPFRRTGGHTGPYGTLVVTGRGIDAGDVGVRSSFDVPSVVRRLLANEPPFRTLDPEALDG